MQRLIDANEILKSEHQHYDYMADEYYVLVRDIENAPTVDTEPVRHGRWKRSKSYKSVIFCDECGEPFELSNSTEHWNYCPNCGAKMDESTMGQVKPRGRERKEDGNKPKSI